MSKQDFNSSEIQRYSRQLNLKEVGIEGQKKLKNSKVICVGSGGLGSPVLLYLAAAGVGKLGIVDSDKVEESNLHRQIIHSMEWINRPKVESAIYRIKEINPYCNVEVFNESLNTNNALDFLKDFDIICDCTDNFPTRYLINDACVILGKPNIYGSIAGFEGQASVFNLTEKSPNYRDLLPNPPPRELLPSCAEAGVLGVIPGIIGLIQANEAIKIILNLGEVLDGRILIFNSLSMKFRELTLKKDPNNSQIKDLINYEDFCSKYDLKNEIKYIRSKDLKILMQKNIDDLYILDVRENHESKEKNIDHTVSIPLSEIINGKAVESIKKDAEGKTIYVYCKSGIRSKKAIIELGKHNLTAINIDGGMDAWM